jgi:formate dehydrogenase subunit delta
MDVDRLVKMANQIALNLRVHEHDRAVAETAAHLRAFWTPKMCRQLADHLEAGGDGLEPIAREAAARVG